MSRRTVLVTVDDRRSQTEPSVDTRWLADLLADVLVAEGVGQGAEAGLHLVDPEDIAALNEEHLGVEGPTDVLSFPIDGVGGGADWMVGDVVLCPSVALAQADDHAGSPDAEMAVLVVHGGLHLCGWDHATADQQAAMWGRERSLMTAAGVVLPRDPWVVEAR